MGGNIPGCKQNGNRRCGGCIAQLPRLRLAGPQKRALGQTPFANWRSAGSISLVAEVVVERFPDFVFQQQRGAAIWFIRERVGTESAVLLENPDALFDRPGSQIIKDQRKIKVGRVPLTVAGQQRFVYLKRFNAFGWRYRLGSFFFSSGAVRALRGAFVLMEAKIPAARAIAAVEFRHCGMLTKSFFLTDEIVGGKTADAYWRKVLQTIAGGDANRRRRNFLQRLASLFRELHECNIYHSDLKDSNILVVPGEDRQGESFYLLDLEGIRRYRRLSWRRRVKNLVQLNRTLGLYLRRIDKCVFARSYLSDFIADRRQRRRWITAVLRRSREKDRQSPGRKRGGAREMENQG
jgi:tRNA A-37 threonylcarbamoyl transferase component Bud32